MSDASRVEALKKMEGFKVKIGYPDKFIDYGPLAVAGDKGGACYLRNVFAGRAFALALDLTRMNAPTDRGRCPSPSQTPLLPLSLPHLHMADRGRCPSPSLPRPPPSRRVSSSLFLIIHFSVCSLR